MSKLVVGILRPKAAMVVLVLAVGCGGERRGSSASDADAELLDIGSDVLTDGRIVVAPETGTDEPDAPGGSDATPDSPVDADLDPTCADSSPPGLACSNECGAGSWVCSAGEFHCEAPPVNECGGCLRLLHGLGAPCEGDCGRGEWVCVGGNAMRCSAPRLDECGTCERRDPEASCEHPTCATATWNCAPGGGWRCDGDENDCGGCGPLASDFRAGRPCRTEGGCDGNWACVNGNSRCISVENPCGDCGRLPGTPGEACGCPLRGAWTCEAGEPVCGEPPPAEEFCDGLDNDCDGEVDEYPACGPTIFGNCVYRHDWDEYLCLNGP